VFSVLSTRHCERSEAISAPHARSVEIGSRPPLDWQERLAEETPDIVMAGFGHHAFLLA
jgi:hypothetical protein